MAAITAVPRGHRRRSRGQASCSSPSPSACCGWSRSRRARSPKRSARPAASSTSCSTTPPHRRPLPLNPTRHGAQLVAAGGPARLRSLAVAAAVVGLLAGIVGAAFVPIAERAVDDAIAVEEANAALPEDPAAHSDDEASVSRSDQRGVGLFGAYAAVRRRLRCPVGADRTRPAAGSGRTRRRVVLAGVDPRRGVHGRPLFKYPPNPPAVGDPGRWPNARACTSR